MEKMVFSGLDAIAVGDEDKYRNEEILRIKLILDNHNEQSDAVLLDSLRKLSNLRPPLSFPTLQATLIGKSVNALRKHGLMEIQNLVKTLIREWKKTVELWLEYATDAIADPISCEEQNPNLERKDTHNKLKSLSPDEPRTPPKNMKAEPMTSLNYEDSGGEGDGDHNDCNKEVLRSCEEENQNRESDRSKPTCVEKMEVHKLKNDEPRCSPKHLKIKIVLKRKAPLEPNGAETGTAAVKRSKYESDPGRLNPVDKKNQMLQQEMKLEAASKRLRQRYQEVENAKKQRRIVFEVTNGPNNGNRNRNRANKGRLHL